MLTAINSDRWYDGIDESYEQAMEYARNKVRFYESLYISATVEHSHLPTNERSEEWTVMLNVCGHIEIVVTVEFWVFDDDRICVTIRENL